jgi:hypothetical protein
VKKVSCPPVLKTDYDDAIERAGLRPNRVMNGRTVLAR